MNYERGTWRGVQFHDMLMPATWIAVLDKPARGVCRNKPRIGEMSLRDSFPTDYSRKLVELNKRKVKLLLMYSGIARDIDRAEIILYLDKHISFGATKSFCDFWIDP